MSKLEEQKALPRRKLFKVVRDELGQALQRDIDVRFLSRDRPKVRKAKKAKRKP